MVTHQTFHLYSFSSARPSGPHRVPIRTPEQGRSHHFACPMQPPGSHWQRAHLLHSLASTFLPMLTTGSSVTQPCVTDHTDKPQEAASATLCCTIPRARCLAWLNTPGSQPEGSQPFTRIARSSHRNQPQASGSTGHFCSNTCGYFSTFTSSTQHRGDSTTPNTIPQPRSAAVPRPHCSPQRWAGSLQTWDTRRYLDPTDLRKF